MGVHLRVTLTGARPPAVPAPTRLLTQETNTVLFNMMIDPCRLKGALRAAIVMLNQAPSDNCRLTSVCAIRSHGAPPEACAPYQSMGFVPEGWSSPFLTGRCTRSRAAVWTGRLRQAQSQSQSLRERG